MATNFEKQVAKHIASEVQGKTLQLGDTTRNKIYEIISQSGDYVSKYGSGIEAQDASAGSSTYHLEVEFPTFNTKAAIGSNIKTSDFKLGSRTHYISKETRIARDKLGIIDTMRFASLVPNKLARAINQDKKLWNRVFFQKVIAATATYAAGQTLTDRITRSANHRIVFIPADLTTNENLLIAWNQLSALRKIIRLHKDATQAIDNMDGEAIVGDIDEYLKRQFNLLGFNSADAKAFIAGTDVEKIATWEGLDVNPYINENTITGKFKGEGDAGTAKTYSVAAMFGTTLSWKFFFQILASNAGNLGDLSNDSGYFYESVLGADRTGDDIVDNTPSYLLKNTTWIVAFDKDFDKSKDVILPVSTATGGSEFITSEASN